MSKQGWCRHYNGIFDRMEKRETCTAGVRYDTVKGHNGRSNTYPCFDANAPVTCPSLSRFTKAELANKTRQRTSTFRRLLGKIADGICPQCNRRMTQEQVGPCVYARPCGHRLFQGSAR